MTLTIYTIECSTTGKKYYGTTKSQNQNYNPIQWFIKKNEESGHYKLLADSVKEHGKKNHVCRIIKTNKTDTEKSDAVFKIVEKLMKADKSLNDVNFSPEKVECDKCNQQVRKCFKDIHDEKYCNVIKVEEELDELFSDEN